MASEAWGGQHGSAGNTPNVSKDSQMDTQAMQQQQHVLYVCEAGQLLKKILFVCFR